MVLRVGAALDTSLAVPVFDLPVTRTDYSIIYNTSRKVRRRFSFGRKKTPVQRKNLPKEKKIVQARFFLRGP
jgi:hypothetical protein